MDPDPRHPGMDPGFGSWKIIRTLRFRIRNIGIIQQKYGLRDVESREFSRGKTQDVHQSTYCVSHKEYSRRSHDMSSHGKHCRSTIITYAGRHWSLFDIDLSFFLLRSLSYFVCTTSCSSPCSDLTLQSFFYS
jgi:hypothetical protein